ncbi:substrate-binding domain-containing protein [Sphaerisporangium sp. NPDC051017]|uniref:substrate-binding domain-containing protein n=1 Tax=Sphaerisporangium sp. NPDC051017 TaxID=3154636 RepID=UPI003441878E
MWLGDGDGSAAHVSGARAAWACDVGAGGTAGGGVGAVGVECLEHPPATALVRASDTLALGVMRALHERGLRPGVDVAITGYDDSPTAALVSPGLTTLRQPIDEVGRHLIQAVDHLMAGDPRDLQHVLLEPELIVRGSSLP